MVYLAGIKQFMVMDGLEKAKLKDRIIRLILEQHTNKWGINAIDRELGSPTKSKAQLNLLIEEMINEAEGAFDYSGNKKMGYVINWNDFTKEFLENGGFEARFKELQEIDRAALEEGKKQQRKESRKECRKTVLDYLKIIGLFVSIPISIFSLIVSLKNKEPDTTHIDSKLSELESRIDEIEKTHLPIPSINKDTIK